MKTCSVCFAEAEDTQETCPACGEASFSYVDVHMPELQLEIVPTEQPRRRGRPPKSS